MFRSIKWRLTISYVLVTLFTAFMIGGLAYGLMQQHIESQELISLESNAQAVAAQAGLLMWPVIRTSDLQSLVTTTSYLGDVRVRVLDSRREVLADSGSSRYAEQFIWVLPSGFVGGELPPFDAARALILPVMDPEHIHEIDELLMMYEVSPEFSFQVIQREAFPWGSRIEFRQGFEQNAARAVQNDGHRVEVPILESGILLGFVEIIGSPGFGLETLQTTTRIIAIATAGAVLFSGIIGLFVAQRVTKPVNELAAATSAMCEGELSIRAPKLGKDEIGQLGQQFNMMADSLETSFRALENERDTLRRFVADASHEIRTPITALRNFIELLEQKRDTKTRKVLLSDSLAQIERLEWITSNLLNLSRLDAGITPLKKDTVRVSELINKAAAPFQPLAKERKLAFKIIPPEDDFDLIADGALLELSLTNLIDNAFKFTPDEGGQVELGCEVREGVCRIQVRDNGVGIDPDDIPHVFDRFFRGKNVEEQGSGLGLAMVKSVIAAHGGEVSVDSELGEGSTFKIDIPLSRTAG